MPVPDVPAALTVRPSGGDDGARIQAALDRVARLPARADGFRGAVVLAPGAFRVRGQLRPRAGGVVLRGAPGGATTIVATGRGRRTLLVAGDDAPGAPLLDSAARVLDETVPAGARSLRVEGAGRFRAGDRVVVTRPSTAAWIRTLGMDTVRGSFADQRVRWTPGSRDLTWDRVVIEVDAARGELVLDAPVTTALEARFGGGTVAAIVRAHLATRLHRMTPRDGWLADSARTSALADARGETVLVYSVDGPSIALARALPRATYRGRWLDPRTGETTPLAGGSPRPGVEIAKPSAQDWLLLLEAR